MPARPLPGPVCVASARCTPVWPAIKGPLLTARIKLCEFVAILQIHPHIVAVIDNCHVGVQSGPRCRVEGGLQRMDVDTYQPLTKILRLAKRYLCYCVSHAQATSPFRCRYVQLLDSLPPKTNSGN